VKWSSLLLGLAAGVLLIAPVLAVPAGAALRSDASTEPAIGTPTPGTTFTTPADGRIRGQDFAGTVTGVAWPERAVINGRTVLATPGHRFVAFTLQLTENASAIAPNGSDPAVTATVQWANGSTSLSLATINAEIAGTAPSTSWTSGSAQFVVAVPNRLHTVDLVLHQGSFSQSFNLWTLRRDSTAPAVLYRDPSRPTLSSPTAASTTLTMSNPADGFSSTAQVEVQSATLSYFPVSGSGAGPVIVPSQALLSLVVTATYPVDPNDASGSGHYLGSQSPLPANLLSFTPAGAAAVTPTLSESGETTGQADDDGLFDALYTFVVPASLTTGTLTIGPGSFTGTEFTLYTAEDGNTTVDLVAPATVGIGFPALPVVADQKRPPWVGAALPPTAAPNASAAGNPLTTSPGHGFPIWLAVLVVVLLAAGVVVAQRLLGRRRLVTPAVSVVEPKTAPPTPIDDPVLTFPAGEQVSSAPVAPTSSPPAPAPALPSPPMLRVLGPIAYDSYRQTSVRRVVEELLCWLVLHNAHAHNADEIQLALRPVESSRPEVTRKTLHSYLSGLRQCIGADHLPDASGAAGYRVTGIECDWFVFARLSDEADSTTGPESIQLRQRALALVRGVPFQGVADGQYEWVFSEDLHIRMASAVIACALRLTNDLMALGRYKEAEEAASAGLLAAPKDEELRRMWNLAIARRNEGLTRPGRSIEDERDEDEPDPEGPEEPVPTR
jgi:DNA-binding SARP family transcriptional activator